ncbi:hypothetical protein T11_3866 [Trichinella zimbabwensis]|uniref:Uncharacterized protein n=1 Tax=Trichinella zimbabwensis TaxID=268475 RepID=A0A0V1I5M3_9BILA|nr:hypothetical protein T11_3866 [Trichinella zimbabwensis]
MPRSNFLSFLRKNGNISLRKGWTNCAQNAAAARIEAQLLASEEIYRRVDALHEDHEVSLDDEERKCAMVD